ncbi:MAG: AraC family transcriptional regulator [Ruminococcus sp.]|nr:AraC family transcriptional regulator [Ruminococcus sp.]
MIKNITEFCHYFYAATRVPVSLYEGGELLAACPDGLYDFYSPDNLKICAGFFSKPLDCHITNSHAYLGYVKVQGDTKHLILGPATSTPFSNTLLHEFMQEFIIAPGRKTDFSQFLSTLPLISYSHFLDILSYLHLCLNDEVVHLGTETVTTDPSATPGLDNRHMKQIFKAKEEQHFHNTYLYEQELFSYVRTGDEHGLETFLAHSTVGLVAGVTAKNPLRNLKNLFISSITQATRAAVTGGLDTEQAYHLSDVYIQECEVLQDINAVARLQYSMLLDFTRRVAKSRIPGGMSTEVFRCVQFISCHTADSISIDDVVAHVGRSRSYLTKKFKKELGFDMGAFIMRCKLEEAKSLLANTSKSLSEISNYLCFSSQSYFQTVFKKQFGITPMQYRDSGKTDIQSPV